MKNIFSYNVTNQVKESNLISIRETSDDLKRRVQEVNIESVKLSSKLHTPKWLSIAYFLTLYFGILVCILFIQFLFGHTFLEALRMGYKNLILGFGLILISLILKAYKKLLGKRLNESDEVVEINKKSDLLLNEVMSYLNIPKDHLEIDLLNYPYLVKDGNISSIVPFFSHINSNFMMFKENDKLCFADVNNVFGINLKDIKHLYEVNQNLNVGGWNKKEKPTSKKYRPYNLKLTSRGVVILPKYYSLVFNLLDQDFEILIPPYEIKKIQDLLSLEIEKQE